MTFSQSSDEWQSPVLKRTTIALLRQGESILTSKRPAKSKPCILIYLVLIDTSFLYTQTYFTHFLVFLRSESYNSIMPIWSTHEASSYWTLICSALSLVDSRMMSRTDVAVTIDIACLGLSPMGYLFQPGRDYFARYTSGMRRVSSCPWSTSQTGLLQFLITWS